MKICSIITKSSAVLLLTMPLVVNADGVTELVSVNSEGEQGVNSSGWASLSGDGRFVTFFSAASNLVAGDTNSAIDVFVHDRITGSTEAVSINSDGSIGNAGSYFPEISADGRYVVFTSDATNLVDDDTNGKRDTFVHDRLMQTTERISIASDGSQGNRSGFFGSISADGRFVAFLSDSTNLGGPVSPDEYAGYNYFIRDRQIGTTDWVGYGSATGVARPRMSGNGRFVAFHTAYPYSPDDFYAQRPFDIYVYDRITKTYQQASLSDDEQQGNGLRIHYLTDTAISYDGRYVVFSSYSTNLVVDDLNEYPDLFIRDFIAQSTELVSVDSYGVQANSLSSRPDISADGRFVSFESWATNLNPEGIDGPQNVFLRDRYEQITQLVSKSSEGVPSNRQSYYAGISADGRYVAFTSNGTNLVHFDQNETHDIFVHDRIAPESLILELIEYTETLNLKQGISNNLDSKLNAAIKALDDLNANNNAAACGSLEAFIHAVNGQQGTSISESDAIELLAGVEEILFTLNCN